MEVSEKYVVYKLNRVMGSETHLALEEIYFSRTGNWFDTEQEAIDALIEMGNEHRFYDIVILKRIHLH